jgi:hypothetical protein
MKTSLSCALSGHHKPREAFLKLRVKKLEKGRNKKGNDCVGRGGG